MMGPELAFVLKMAMAVLSALSTYLIREMSIPGNVVSELKKVMDNMSFICKVLVEVEKKPVIDNSVKGWFENLKEITYEVHDIVDEINTKDRIRTLNKKSSICWKSVDLGFKPSANIFDKKMLLNLEEVSKKLQVIWEKGQRLQLARNIGGLGASSSGDSSSFHKGSYVSSTSLVDRFPVYGRDEEKRSIINMLFEDTSYKICVISIVGMGGIGKTTLAQQVYNDKHVMKRFSVRIWICVSQIQDMDFDVISITKTIYETIAKRKSSSDDLSTLQKDLRDMLANRKFLIVWDDVWIRDCRKWNTLCVPLCSGSRGSRIIVTSRDESIGSTVGYHHLTHRVKLLSNDDCHGILAQHSLSSFQRKSKFSNEVATLVEKTGGLPMAAVALGCAFRRKENIKSEIWNVCIEKDILPALKRSYDDLPPHLKILFAYCSLFPVKYDFRKRDLVYLWMGEGFLEHVNTGERKKVALEYFDELLSRSLFQRSSGSDVRFSMHPLIIALAKSIVGREFLVLNENSVQEYHVTGLRLLSTSPFHGSSVGDIFSSKKGGSEIRFSMNPLINASAKCFGGEEFPDLNDTSIQEFNARHCSFLRHEYEAFHKFNAQNKGLRTLLPMPLESEVGCPTFLSSRILDELFLQMQRLRVLSLSGYDSITELPGSICRLIHLRYLNLSRTKITALPYSVGALVNLEILLMEKCYSLRKLPASLGNLLNLRYLCTWNTALPDMPIEIGQLTSLESLPEIVLGRGKCFGLKELKELKFLSGTLVIYNLHNVTTIKDVKSVGMRYKDKIDTIQLIWGSHVSNHPNRVPENYVLEELQPHENIIFLSINFYRGSKFPIWIGHHSYTKLSTVNIDHCLECTTLPSLGSLPGLEYLHIWNVPNVHVIGQEFYGNTSIPFPKLKVLTFENLPGWRKWTSSTSSDGIRFPKLEELSLKQCANLMEVSQLSFPVLNKLFLGQCNKAILVRISSLTSLTSLKMHDIPGLTGMPSRLMKSMVALEEFECVGCDQFSAIWPHKINHRHPNHSRPLDVIFRLLGFVCTLCCNGH